MTPESVRLTADAGGTSTVRGRALIALREMLLKGDFAVGKRLVEIDLSRSLGLSRPILRLPATTLQGLLEPLPAGGYVARHFTVEDIRDAILARTALEGLAAGLAAKRIQHPLELDPARKLNAALAESLASSAPDLPTPEEMARFGDLNAAFHSAFVEVARSPMLKWCLQRVQSAAFASPAAVVLPTGGDGARRAFAEHEHFLTPSRLAPPFAPTPWCGSMLTWPLMRSPAHSRDGRTWVAISRWSWCATSQRTRPAVARALELRPGTKPLAQLRSACWMRRRNCSGKKGFTPPPHGQLNVNGPQASQYHHFRRGSAVAFAARPWTLF